MRNQLQGAFALIFLITSTCLLALDIGPNKWLFHGDNKDWCKRKI